MHTLYLIHPDSQDSFLHGSSLLWQIDHTAMPAVCFGKLCLQHKIINTL